MREHASGQPLEFLVVAGPRERCVAHVVAHVEVWVIDPHRASLTEGYEREPLSIAGN